MGRRELCNRSYSGYAWQLTATIATPLSVRVVDEWVYELHNYYSGIGIDDLVVRNKYRISGDYLGAMHNSLAFTLGRLHRDGFVHRDVRPQNILVRDDGSITLLDCTFICQQSTVQNPIDSGVYTAPEQLEGKAEAQSDLYSLAATLYFVAFGYPPPRSVSKEILDGLFG